MNLFLYDIPKSIYFKVKVLFVFTDTTDVKYLIQAILYFFIIQFALMKKYLVACLIGVTYVEEFSAFL